MTSQAPHQAPHAVDCDAAMTDKFTRLQNEILQVDTSTSSDFASNARATIKRALTRRQPSLVTAAVTTIGIAVMIGMLNTGQATTSQPVLKAETTPNLVATNIPPARIVGVPYNIKPRVRAR